MQYILLEMVSSLGKDFQFAGIGTVATDVGEPDENKFWLLRSGSYTNFGAPFEVAENEFAVVTYNGTLNVQKIPVGRPVDNAITENGQNPVEGGAIFAQFAQLRAAGYLFAGLATKNMTPPAERPENIFYLCTQGGVYTNFDNLNLQRGLNIILWNGTQWQGNNVFLITDEILTGSDALPTAGSVFEELEKKVDKAEGKGLSQNDFTNTEKTKLEGLPTADELYTKTEINELLAAIAQELQTFPTTESVGEAIAAALTDYYTKTETDEDIAEAIGKVADLSIEKSPELILTNTPISVNLTIRSQVDAESLTITRDGYQVATGSGKVLMAIDNVNIQTAGTLTYVLTAVIGSVERTQEFTIDVMDAVYYGAGTQATDITTKATARKTPAGRYTIVAAQGDNLFVLCPSGMSIQGMRMNGLDLPVESPTGMIIDDKSYLCYKSSNAYEAGTYVIDVY